MISDVECIDNMEYMSRFPDKFFDLANHPHEKPVSLYRWTLKEYAKMGDRLIDTHLGSQSSRIAAEIEGFDFYGCELDPKYFESGCKRYEQHTLQQTLF